MIRLSTEQIRSRANSFQIESEQQAELLMRIKRLRNQMEAEWEGESAKRFLARFDELTPSVVKMVEMLDEINNYLVIVASKFEAADQA